MSQFSFGDIDTDETDGSELADMLEDFEGAIQSLNKGSSTPSYAVAGTPWLDDTSTPWLVKQYDGSDWITLGAFNATANTYHPYQGTTPLKFTPHAADTGSANTYIIAPSPAIDAYRSGQIFFLKPANTNSGASTINVNGKGAVNIKTPTGADPGAGTLLTTAVYMLMHDGTNAIILNVFQTLSSLGAAALASAQTFSGAQGGAITTLTDGSTITPDFSLNNNFKVTLGGNRTLANPSNLVAGRDMSGCIDIHQDATGSRTLAYAWGWNFPSGTVPVLSTPGCTKDSLYYDVKVYASSTVTITLASPGVVSWTGHGLVTGQRVQLTTTGSLPTGLTASTSYYVIVNDADSFWLATSLANAAAGTKINTSVSQSGTHTCTAITINANLVKAFA